MNAKEAAELRRRLQAGRHNITHILGCYVNEQREIISTFRESVGMMSENDEEKYLALLRKVLSGKMGRNLKDVVFTTRQVADSPEHRLLSALRNSQLQDGAAVETFYRTVIDALPMEGNYLILLACNTYDVPHRDGELDRAEGDGRFPHILCSICPVKQGKPALSYVPQEQTFHLTAGGAAVAMPELGFLFPAFDGRSANLYGALYYTRSIAENYQPFVDAVFHTEVAMPAAEQQEVFQSMLTDALGEDCRYEVVQTVHDRFSALTAASQENRLDEPLAVDKDSLRSLLEDCGVSAQHVAAFSVRYDENFGYDALLSPDNLVDTKQFKLSTPNVTVRVDPDRSDLVQTRIIDGTPYILIRVEEGVEVNGVNIHLEGEPVVSG